jgi:hypothetical protein
MRAELIYTSKYECRRADFRETHVTSRTFREELIHQIPQVSDRRRRR